MIAYIMLNIVSWLGFVFDYFKSLQMDIDQAKKDWELNRLMNRREEEERRAELEEDDMLYTYSKEDAMNQVQRPIKRHKTNPKTSKVTTVVPSRKSNRPPRPKQFGSESEEESEPRPVCVDGTVKRKRGRPKGSGKKSVNAEKRTIRVKSSSSAELMTLQRKPGGQTYIVSAASKLSTLPPRQLPLTPSDNSDVDVESAGCRRSSRQFSSETAN